MDIVKVVAVIKMVAILELSNAYKNGGQLEKSDLFEKG